MTAYIIAIGGTGAKLVESVIHAAAVGLFSDQVENEDLRILLIDPDVGNGNAAAAANTRTLYQNCHQLFNTNPSRSWMSSDIDPVQSGAWSVFDRVDATLKDAFEYSNYNDQDERKLLFDVLYTEEERQVRLTEGFRGRPAIGAAIISQLTKKEKQDANWQALIEQIDSEHHAGKFPKVFLCGSIFGGTGAAGLPTLGRLLANKLGTNGKNLLQRIKFGCLLLLPYFQFDNVPQKAGNETVFARSQDFVLKTEAALRYYANQTELAFDSVYLLGLPKFSSVDNFSIGGSDQRNSPHFLEFYGALALRDFLLTDKPPERRVTLLSREQQDALTWNDIPEFDVVRTRLVAATRFAFAWLAAIAPDLEHARDRPREVTWSLKFFKPQELKSATEQDNIKVISNWCENYLRWLGAIGRSEPFVRWFNWDIFLNKDGSLRTDRNKFQSLVPDLEIKAINEILIKLNPRDVDSPNQGAVGLAKALYQKIDGSL